MSREIRREWPACRSPISAHRTARVRLVALVVVVAPVVQGCGLAGSSTEFVEGTVLLDGAAVADATVAFSPLDPEGVFAYGRTDAGGVYRLTTSRGGRAVGGAVAGRYAVTVTKTEITPSAVASFQALRRKDIVFLVPDGYSQPAASGLSVTVRKGRNVGPEFRFDLKSSYVPADLGGTK